MNCVSSVDIFLSLKLTLKMQVSNTVNIVDISSKDKISVTVAAAVTTDVQSALHQHARRLTDEYATDSLPHR